MTHARMTESTERIRALRDNVQRVFLGSREAVDHLICCVLGRGHVLIEDVPGVGKTVLATALARSMDCTFSRIQLTPDMLPSDVIGVSVFDRSTGQFSFKPGPIFANIVLADEINRTPPRTQSALLEAMNEATVSVDGRSIELERPFMVVATQNPYEFEGTYPLPENQLDRFLMRINVGYPSPADELRVLDVRPANGTLHDLKPVITRAQVIELQDRVDQVKVETSILEYIVAFAGATRKHEAIHLGLSPRGALALAQAARATALYAGRDYVVPDDVIANVEPVCVHRIIARGGAGRAGTPVVDLVRMVLRSVPSPA
ncbi:MAG: MoxR family ATPase [Phycisphaerales bacterium]|jgi:MoxR-like ATPase|nr:MoxR family ATPase [Phycisphaerales bacterium]